MLFEFTEEQLMIKQAAKDFAVNECLPGVIERDEHQKFPKEQIEKLADLGFMGMMVKPEYGGSGLDTISYVLAMEEISKIDASVSVVMSVNNSLVCYGLQEYGNEEQKIKYLTPLAQGIKNGELLRRVPTVCDVFVTLDRNLEFQQNIKALSFGVVVVRSLSNRMADLIPHISSILSAASRVTPGTVEKAGA